MELTFLGTGSAYPTPTRGASCIIFKLDGTYWMFDCGEGSQIQLMRSTIRAGRISRIFITHLHGDHMFGLPGLMCTISQNAGAANGEEKPVVNIYGPHGLRKFIRTSLQLSRSQLGFNYSVHELQPTSDQLPDDWQSWSVDHDCDSILHPNELMGQTIHPEPDNTTWNVCEDDRLIVKAGALKHRIPSFGFVIEEKPLPGKLDVEKLKSLGIHPGPLYSKLKSGEAIENPQTGNIIHPDDVLGPGRPVCRVAILGDSCCSDKMVTLCRDVDLLVHEATLGNCMHDSALEKGHSTPDMAAKFAASVQASCLVLTHFSQRFKAKSCSNLKEEEESVALLEQEAQSVLPNCQVIAVDDFTTVCLAAKSKPGDKTCVTVTSQQQ